MVVGRKVSTTSGEIPLARYYNPEDVDRSGVFPNFLCLTAASIPEQGLMFWSHYENRPSHRP